MSGAERRARRAGALRVGGICGRAPPWTNLLCDDTDAASLRRPSPRRVRRGWRAQPLPAAGRGRALVGFLLPGFARMRPSGDARAARRGPLGSGAAPAGQCDAPRVPGWVLREGAVKRRALARAFAAPGRAARAAAPRTARRTRRGVLRRRGRALTGRHGARETRFDDTRVRPQSQRRHSAHAIAIFIGAAQPTTLSRALWCSGSTTEQRRKLRRCNPRSAASQTATAGTAVHQTKIQRGQQARGCSGDEESAAELLIASPPPPLVRSFCTTAATGCGATASTAAPASVQP